MKTLFLLIATTGVAVGGFFGYRALNAPDQAGKFRTSTVDRGDLRWVINAMGQVQPVTTRDVGSQVSGVIQELGAYYNSRVKRGQVIAQLDKRIFTAKCNEDQAELKKAQADLVRFQALLERAQSAWDRAQKLRDKGQNLINDNDFDAAKANFATAKADLEVANAAVDIVQRNLDSSKINLSYTTIESPVDGVVIDRKVNVGQTVAAGLQAPSLFLIAEDLSKVQIIATVDEADIGRIGVEHPVTFSVDTYGTEVFNGRVWMIRLNPITIQNVTTYNVVIETDNPPVPPKYPYGKLLPGMTAKVSFLVEERRDVLRIPNAAVRFRPDSALIAPDVRADFETSAKPSPAQKRAAKATADEKTAWIADGEYLRPVKVSLGISNGSLSELLSGELKPGDEVVLGMIGGHGPSSENNPFTPPVSRKRN